MDCNALDGNQSVFVRNLLPLVDCNNLAVFAKDTPKALVDYNLPVLVGNI